MLSIVMCVVNGNADKGNASALSIVYHRVPPVHH